MCICNSCRLVGILGRSPAVQQGEFVLAKTNSTMVRWAFGRSNCVKSIVQPLYDELNKNPRSSNIFPDLPKHFRSGSSATPNNHAWLHKLCKPVRLSGSRITTSMYAPGPTVLYTLQDAPDKGPSLPGRPHYGTTGPRSQSP